MKFHIKEARESAGYSQKELAEIVGVAPNTFHGYESGKHDPKSDLLVKIATACHVTVDFLLGASTPQAPAVQTKVPLRPFIVSHWAQNINRKSVRA